MQFTKIFAASILAAILSISASALDRCFTDSNALLGMRETYTIAPSFANVTISGRVKTPEGRPIKTALIVLKDADTNEVVRNTYSSSFGYYSLEQIEPGRLYVLSVSHKRYLFAFPAQLIEITENRTGVDFVGEDGVDN